MADSEFRFRHFAFMMLAAFFCYLPMIMPLSSLSIYVTRDLGLSNFLAGVAAGAGFLTTFAFRRFAGGLADRFGGKRCFILGSLGYAAGGLVCLVSVLGDLPRIGGFAALLSGRLILGFAESLANVGMGHWCIGRMGMARAGKVMASHGMCLYGTVAFGGWVGYTLYERFGFASVLAVCVLAPLLALAIALPSPESAPPVPAVSGLPPPSLWNVVSRIWRLSLPCGLHAVGFAVLSAFLSKTFLERGWDYAGIAFTVTGVGFVGMRLVLGGLPDKWGGVAVARLSGLVEMLGGYLLWLAPGPLTGLAGALLVGAGCSMVFPSLTLEVVRLAPESIRGICMSVNSASIDAAYCFSGPIAGLAIDRLGGGDDQAAYLMGALAVTLGQILLLSLSLKPSRNLSGRSFSARWFRNGDSRRDGPGI
ncbi:MAG: MFS transporter [Planctomycetota bacterium]|jgi:MFS family permease|nr:MFS transporter [Planctomycetota bacterium]